MNIRTHRRLSIRSLLFLLTVSGLTVIGLSLVVSKANAAVCTDNGSACNVGYFSRQTVTGQQHNLYYGNDYTWGGSPFLLGFRPANVDQLKNLVGVRLSCTNGGNPPTVLTSPGSQNSTAAAFTVLTMLGAPPGTSKNVACQRFWEWAGLMDQYAAAGLISFSEWKALDGVNTRLSYNQGTDVSYYADWEAPSETSVVFRSPLDGSILYAIKRDCGNPIGVLRWLPRIVGTPSCAGFTVTPGVIDPQTRFNISARINYNSTLAATLVRTAPGTTFYLKIDGPSMNYNQNLPISQSGATLSIAASNLGPTNNTGKYFVTWGIRSVYGNVDCGGDGTVPGPGGPDNPPSSFEVSNLPYFKVNGGDVSSGAGMSAGGVDCAVPANSRAGIVSWNKGASGGYAGAGTHYAAMALSHLQEFATAQGTGALRPSGLAFANDGSAGINVAGGIYGGLFGGLPCVKDYYGTPPATAKPWGTFSQVTPNVVDAYKVNGPYTFFAPTVIPKGDHVTLYVNGDVYISGNITYSGNGSYANVGEIPSFRMIVKGSIYVAPWVTRLDGLYVAQPTTASSGDGNIYTCSLVDSTPSDPAHPYQAATLNGTLYNTCQNQLTVDGAFVANQVWLLRTDGSVSNIPAESFNFTGELWLSGAYDFSTDAAAPRKYDSITSLPPVL